MPSRTGDADVLCRLLTEASDCEDPLAGCDPTDACGDSDPCRFEPAADESIAGLYSGLFQRVARRIEEREERAGRERDRAAALYDELLAAEPPLREERILGDERFASFALAELLLEAALEVRPEDRSASRELAHLGLLVADHLDAGLYGPRLLEDLKARSWAYLGESWVGIARPASIEAFRLAESHLRRGTGDPLDEAEILTLSAAECVDRAEISEARRRIDQAARIYLLAGERRRLGENFAAKARLAAREGDHRGATELLRHALALLVGEAPGRTLAEVGYELARSLQMSGSADQAWTEIAHARIRLAGEPAPRLKTRLLWLEGRVAATLGLAAEARAHLEAALAAFTELDLPEEAARVHLDLAALHSRASDEDYARGMSRIAETTPHLLAAGNLGRETISTLLLVQQAAERRSLTAGLVGELSAFLDRVA